MPLFALLTAQRTGALFFTLVGALWNFQAIGGEPLVGWAASGGGTTGGADGPSYSVATAEELSRALKRPSPKTILIRGSITLNEFTWPQRQTRYPSYGPRQVACHTPP